MPWSGSDRGGEAVRCGGVYGQDWSSTAPSTSTSSEQTPSPGPRPTDRPRRRAGGPRRRAGGAEVGGRDFRRLKVDLARSGGRRRRTPGGFVVQADRAATAIDDGVATWAPATRGQQSHARHHRGSVDGRQLRGRVVRTDRPHHRRIALGEHRYAQLMVKQIRTRSWRRPAAGCSQHSRPTPRSCWGPARSGRRHGHRTPPSARRPQDRRPSSGVQDADWHTITRPRPDRASR